MIYLAGFAVTYVLVLVLAAKLPARDDRYVLRRRDGGIAFRPRKLLFVGLFLLCSLPLFLISALREGIGTDYYFTYTPRFLEILQGERTYYEIGFYYFNRLVGAFTSNPQWIFVATSAVYMLFVFLAFYENTDELPFCVLLLLASGEYLISLNNLRQAMAASVLLFGYRFLRREQWVRFGLLTLLCATLHQSMLVFLPVLLLIVAMKYIRLERLLPWLTIGVLAAWLLFQSDSAILRMFLPERLLYYIEYAIYNEPTIGKARILVNVVLFVFLLLARRLAKDKELDIFVLIQFLAVALCLFDAMLPATYRILRLFTFWQLLGLPIAVGRFSRRYGTKIVLQIALLGLLGALNVYSIVYLGTEEVLPYHSIFH